jgi:hypothetical protein
MKEAQDMYRRQLLSKRRRLHDHPELLYFSCVQKPDCEPGAQALYHTKTKHRGFWGLGKI